MGKTKNNWRCKLPGNCLHYQASTSGFILQCLKLWRVQWTCCTRLLCICFFSIARRHHDIMMITKQGLPEESVIFRSRVNDIKVTVNSPNAECFYFVASQIPSVQNRRHAIEYGQLSSWLAWDPASYFSGVIRK